MKFLKYLIPKSKSASLQDSSGSLRRESSSLNLLASSSSTTPGVSRNTSWVDPWVKTARAFLRVVLFLQEGGQTWILTLDRDKMQRGATMRWGGGLLFIKRLNWGYMVEITWLCPWFLTLGFHKVVGDYINIMKTTFDLNLDFYQAFRQHGYTKMETKRSCQ